VRRARRQGAAAAEQARRMDAAVAAERASVQAALGALEAERARLDARSAAEAARLAEVAFRLGAQQWEFEAARDAFGDTMRQFAPGGGAGHFLARAIARRSEQVPPAAAPRACMRRRAARVSARPPRSHRALQHEVQREQGCQRQPRGPGAARHGAQNCPYCNATACRRPPGLYMHLCCSHGRLDAGAPMQHAGRAAAVEKSSMESSQSVRHLSNQALRPSVDAPRAQEAKARCGEQGGAAEAGQRAAAAMAASLALPGLDAEPRVVDARAALAGPAAGPAPPAEQVLA